MTMESLPTILFQVEGEDMVFNSTTFIGLNDADTRILLVNETVLSQNVPKSILLSDDSTVYQNTTGQDAFASIIVEMSGADGASAAWEAYSAPTSNSIAGATKVFENLGGMSGVLDANGQTQTATPLKISNGHFIVINLSTTNHAIFSPAGSFVVERG